MRQSLLREFSDIVRKLKDPRVGCANVVDAEISPDLRYAKLFFSVLGSEEDKADATIALERAAGFIRRELAQRLQLRYAPEVTVVYDDTSERAARLTALIDTLGVSTGDGRSGVAVKDAADEGNAAVGDG